MIAALSLRSILATGLAHPAVICCGFPSQKAVTPKAGRGPIQRAPSCASSSSGWWPRFGHGKECPAEIAPQPTARPSLICKLNDSAAPAAAELTACRARFIWTLLPDSLSAYPFCSQLKPFYGPQLSTSCVNGRKCSLPGLGCGLLEVSFYWQCS